MVWLLLLLALTGAPTGIGPYDARAEYLGRFDRREAAGPRCNWAGSQVRLAFQGRSLTIRLHVQKEDYLAVVVDGADAPLLKLVPGQETYKVVDGLPAARHDVRLIKRTEPLVDTMQFLGFSTDGSFVKPPPPSARRLEVIGDSITCGYGNEAAGKDEHFNRGTENNWETYEAMAARATGADYTAIAWSGRTMYPDDTMPSIYDEALAGDASSVWNFSWVPQAVVINLGTNDFRNGPPNRDEWTAAYHAFVQRVRRHYPRAHIFCAVGSMVTDNWPPHGHYLTILRGYLHDVVSDSVRDGDLNVSFLEMPEQKAEDGYGADWHPSIATHRKMARALVDALHRELGWREVAPIH